MRNIPDAVSYYLYKLATLKHIKSYSYLIGIEKKLSKLLAAVLKVLWV